MRCAARSGVVARPPEADEGRGQALYLEAPSGIGLVRPPPRFSSNLHMGHRGDSGGCPTCGTARRVGQLTVSTIGVRRCCRTLGFRAIGPAIHAVASSVPCSHVCLHIRRRPSPCRRRRVSLADEGRGPVIPDLSIRLRASSRQRSDRADPATAGRQHRDPLPSCIPFWGGSTAKRCDRMRHSAELESRRICRMIPVLDDLRASRS